MNETLRRIALVSCLSLLASAASAETAEMDLKTLLDDHWEWQMKQSPVWATMLGDHRYDDPCILRFLDDSWQVYR